MHRYRDGQKHGQGLDVAIALAQNPSLGQFSRFSEEYEVAFQHLGVKTQKLLNGFIEEGQEAEVFAWFDAFFAAMVAIFALQRAVAACTQSRRLIGHRFICHDPIRFFSIQKNHQLLPLYNVGHWASVLVN